MVDGNSNKHILDVDIKIQNYIAEPIVRKNDDVVFIINISDDGKPFDLSGVKTATIACERQDKVVIIPMAGAITGANQVTFSVSKSALSVVGRVNATIQLYGDFNRVSTISFNFTVQKDPTGTDYMPDEGDKSLIEVVLGDGPLVIADARAAADEASAMANAAETAAQEADAAKQLTIAATANAKTETDYIKGARPLIEQSITDSTTAKVTAESVRTEFDAVVLRETDSDAMSRQAAINTDGVDELNLKARLDKEHREVTTALAETTKDINTPLFNLKKKNEINSISGTRNIHVMGDSISHGANAPDMANDSWTGILRKLLQHEFNTKNHGFVNLKSEISNVLGTYKDVIDVSTSGVWSPSNSENNLGGYIYKSSDSNGKLIITIKEKASRVEMLYDRTQVNPAEFDLVVNGIVARTVSTGGTDRFDMISPSVSLEGYEFPVVLEVVKKDALQTTFSGIQLYDGRSEMFFHNFARTGLKLIDLSNSTIQRLTDCNVLFFALGHNDRYSNVSLSTFSEKINIIRDEVNSNGAFLVVVDFLWYEPITDGFRSEIKRLYDEVENSVYVPFPDYLYGSVRETWKEKGFLGDSSHPTVLGHKLIAETIAKKISLSITSKESIANVRKMDSAITALTALPEANNEWKIIDEFQNGWVPLFASEKYKTKYKKVNGIVFVEVFLKSGAANTVAFNIPAGFRPSAHFRFIFDVTNAGVKIGVQMQETGNILIYTDSPTANIQGTFSFIATA